jgi:hypothetical protein
MAVPAITLEKGKHSDPSDGMCLLEAVAFVAGEPFTDRPACVSPVLAAFGRYLNDALPRERRQHLASLIPLLIGTVGAEADERDGLRCAHWLIAHWVPAWLDLVPELAGHAAALRALPEPSSWSDVGGWAVGDAAWDAAGDSAGDAAWSSAGNAARAAVWASAGAAARDAVWACGGDLPWDPAEDAPIPIAWAAARAAAGDALQPTILQLQQDTIDLFTELVEGRH